MADDGYVGDVRTEVLSELQAKLREALGKRDEEHERNMLSSWLDEDVELPENREELHKLYRKIYTRKVEGDHDTPFMERLSEMSSEDYEALDYHEGWGYGFGAAQQIVTEMISESYAEQETYPGEAAAKEAVRQGVWEEA
jgi:hypothetical protein